MRLIDADNLKSNVIYYVPLTMDKTYLMIDNQPTKNAFDVWIPCSERLPDKPEENPVFDNKALDLYLVSIEYTDYPFRAFWNGKIFTDGFEKLNVIAWMPLPEPYKVN